MRGTFEAIVRWFREHAGFRLYALALLASMAVAYDFQLFNMGSYYDDWEGVFLYKEGFSALQIWIYFLRDRPFSTFVHLLFNPILGAEPVGWHIAGLLLNWAAILFLVRALLQLWPRRTMEIGWIGLLLGVYPGIHRQFVVHTSMPHYASMFLFTLSLLLMVKMVQGGRYRWLLLAASLVLALAQTLIIEYFAGLELVRVLILFYMFRATTQTWKQAIKPTLLAWLPYALVLAGFFVYRFEILPAIQVTQKTPSHTLEIFGQLLQDPRGTLLHYVQSLIQDVWYAILYAWSTAWIPQDLNLQSRAVLFSWIAGLALAALCAVLMWAWHSKNDAAPHDEHPAFVLILCIGALLLGGLPIWIIDDWALSGTWADRFLFGPIFGAVPLLMLFLIWVTGPNRKQILNVICALLAASSIALQFRVANDYATNWKYQRDFYWQLKWRVPSLQPGSFILSTSTPFGLNDHYQIAYAINTIYAPAAGTTDVAYWWFNGPEALLDNHTGRYQLTPIDHRFRTLRFQSDMQHALPVLYDKSGGRCLQVADPVYRSEPLLDRNEQMLFAVTHVEMIQTKDQPMPQDVFGPEPAYDWCYYYQRADLARQFGQWDQVLKIWDAAASSLAELRYGPEYLPFIEAFARTADWSKAATLTLSAQQITPNMQPFLCQNWKRILKATPATDARAAAWAKVQGAVGCK